MATLPTAQEIYDYLEGFGIDQSVTSKSWIEEERDHNVVPFIEHLIKRSLSTEESVTEYISGRGTDVVMLSKRGINSLVSIEYIHGAEIESEISLDCIELMSAEGMLKSKTAIERYNSSRYFVKGNKNIKVVYKVGGTLTDALALAVKKLCCVCVLDQIEGRTGGGSLSVQGFSRDHGNMGRYSNYRKRLTNQAMTAIDKYMTSVVSS